MSPRKRVMIERTQILQTLSIYTLQSIKKKDLRKNLVCSVIFLEPVTVMNSLEDNKFTFDLNGKLNTA